MSELSKKLLFATLAFLVTTIGISSLAGLSAWILGSKFWGWFTICTIAQITISLIVKPFSDKKYKRELAHLNEIRALAESESTVDLTCAYCATINRIPIFFNQDNYFTCAHSECNQRNLVMMQFSTARVTTPISQKPFKEMAAQEALAIREEEDNAAAELAAAMAAEKVKNEQTNTDS